MLQNGNGGAEHDHKLRFREAKFVYITKYATVFIFISCIGSALLSQNYWCHVTSTLYKPDTSLRWTVWAGFDSAILERVNCTTTSYEKKYYCTKEKILYTIDIDI